MTEDIKQKIRDEANSLFKSYEYADQGGQIQQNHKATEKKKTQWTQGAHFGYNLSIQEIEARDKEIAYWKRLYEEAVKYL